MEKWYKNIYRRQLVDMHINDTDPEFFSKFSPEEYVENLKKAHINCAMIYIQSHIGLCYFPTNVAKTHEYFLKQGNEKKINHLFDLLKQEGITAVAYYSLIFNNVAAERHPEWKIRYADGTTWDDHGQRYGLVCPNNEEYRQFVVEQLKEIAAQNYKIDGIFFDMPYWEVTCHCDACKARWEKEVGGEMPGDTPDWNSPTWKKYVEKRQTWMVDFVKFVKEQSEQILKGVTVEFNFAAVIGCDWLGGSTEGINDYCEFTGGDLYGDLFSHSFTAKYYYGITKNQPFEYMTCRCNKNLREHTITKPESMLETEVLLTTAHHGATLNIDAINPDGTLDSRVYERLGKVFEKQMLYEQYMNKGEMFGEVAVYFDSKTQYKEQYSETYNKLCAVNAHKALVEAHIPTKVIANGSLNNLEQYYAIVAPCLQDFNNDEVLKFIDYVNKGGTLYLSGKSDSRLMKEFFGTEITEFTYGDSQYKHVFKGYKECQAYISPKENMKAIFGEFNEKYPLPITYKLPILKTEKPIVVGATITLPFSDPDNNREFASIHSNPPMKATEIPALVELAYGHGKVIWSAAYLENDERDNFKELFARLIKNEVRAPLFDIETSKNVEAITFKDGDKYYVSFVDLVADEYKTSSVSLKFAIQRKFKITDLETNESVITDNYEFNLKKFKMFLVEDLKFTGEEFDVIILAGQSNAEGNGYGDCKDPFMPSNDILVAKSFPEVTAYIEDGVQHLNIQENRETIIDRAHETPANFKYRGCMGYFFAREYIRQGYLEKGRKTLIVYAPLGGTGFHRNEWGLGNPLYENLKKVTNDILSLNKNNRIVAFLWHQGEDDAWYGSELTYEQRKNIYLNQLMPQIDDFYKTFRCNAPFIAGEFVYHWVYGCDDLRINACKAVWDATREVAHKYNGDVVCTEGLLSNDQDSHNGDDIHFCRESLNELAKRYFEVFKKHSN